MIIIYFFLKNFNEKKSNKTDLQFSKLKKSDLQKISNNTKNAFENN